MTDQKEISRLLDDKITQYWDFDSDWKYAPQTFRSIAQEAITKPLSFTEKTLMILRCATGNHNWIYVGRNFSQVGVCCNICGKRKLHNLTTGKAKKILEENNIPQNELKAIKDGYCRG